MKKILSIATITIIIQLSAYAGTPLICHQIEIGKTKSLPWSQGNNPKATDSQYDINNLTKDTLGLLNSDMPVLARMETLRRAAIYATLSPSRSETIASELLNKLMDRVNDKLKSSSTPGLALFDAGYFIACYENTGYFKNSTNKPLGKNLNGYSMVKKGVESFQLEHKGKTVIDNYELEFALAIVSSYPRRDEYKEHLQKAVNGAKDGSLLAINLISRYGRKGQSMADLSNQIASAKL